MKKESLVLVIILLLMNISLVQCTESVSDLKEELHTKKETMDENICGHTYLQSTLLDSAELVRNHELLNLDGTDLAHFLNHVLDFVDTAEMVTSAFEEEEFDQSIDALHRLDSLKNSAERKKTVLVSQGYNEFYVDDILTKMDRTIQTCGDRGCLDLITKSDDSNKLDSKEFFLNYAMQLCCEYKSEECEKLNKKHKDVINEIERNERDAENYEEYGDSNLTAARDARVKLFSLDRYDTSIKCYGGGYGIYENVLGMRASDAARLEEKMNDVKLERSNVFQEVLTNYSIYSLISILSVVLGLRITRNYRREIKLGKMIKRVF